MGSKHPFIPYHFSHKTAEEVSQAANTFYEAMNKRRSIRDFSDQPVDQSVIEKIIMTASSAPSGAHKQPWTFCAISNPDIKRQLRVAAEEEEYKNYHGRMNDEWLEDLSPFGTDWNKPFIETCPWIIVMFRQNFEFSDTGRKQHYYVGESVGIAAGFLIAAIHRAGLATLTHTPSPMGFLSKLLQRPKNEKPYLLLPVGYPAADCQVPQLGRKSVSEVIEWYT